MRASRILSESLSYINGVECKKLVFADSNPNPEQIRKIIFESKSANVVLVHFSATTDSLWGNKGSRASALAYIVMQLDRPVVVHLHDSYGKKFQRGLRAAIRGLVREIKRKGGAKTRLKNMKEFLFGLGDIAPEWRSFKILDQSVSAFIVNNYFEREKLKNYSPKSQIFVLPHFIENRTNLIEKLSAKKIKQWSGQKVLTLLGFIHKRKGYVKAIQVLSKLDQEWILVLAGSVTKEKSSYIDHLKRIAVSLGVENRVKITGYLTDKELDIVISATDIAVCPFERVAASGSLNTWLASRKPIITSDLPLFREYANRFPDLVSVVQRDIAEEYARLITELVQSKSLAGNLETYNNALSAYSPKNSAALLASLLEKCLINYK